MSGWLVALLCFLSAIVGAVIVLLALARRFMKGFWRG
jgi:hypothetical protein